MSTNVTSNPFPLGLVKAGAAYATVSVPITTNFLDLATSAPYGQVDSIYVHALAGNSGKIYLCNTAANPDETTYLNVYDVISAGGFTAITSSAMNTIQLASFFIGADNANDGAVCMVKFR